MTRRSLKTALAASAAFALVTASLALGAGAASATDPNNTCGGDGTANDFSTAGAVWWGVCLNDASIEDAYTALRLDAFDGFGGLFFDPSGVNIPIGAPDVNTSVVVNPDSIVYSFTDLGVDVGGGDLVNVGVTRTFTGTFVTWEVEIRDADDNSIRPDVSLVLSGNFGADNNSLYTVTADGIIVHGDESDPVILLQPIGPAFAVNPPVDGNDTYRIDFSGEISFTAALVDYGCTQAPAAYAYAQSILPTLSTHVGESLAVAGGVPCVTTPSPVHFTVGQAIDYTLPLTFVLGGHDFSGGGSVYEWDALPAFLQDESLNENINNVVPGYRVFGTAPSAPGTYTFEVGVWSDTDEFDERFPVTVIIDPAPELAATGTDSAPIVWLAFGLALLGGLFVAGASRRASRT